MELDKKDRQRLRAFEIGLVIIILSSMATAVHIYNKTAGTMCEKNFECKLHCPKGAYNDNFIDIYRGPFGASDCSAGMTAICENAKCKAYDAYNASSVEDCKRAGGGFYEFLCFLAMAEKQDNASICDEIQLDFDKSYCYFELARKTGNLSLCAGATDPELRRTCITELFTPPEDKYNEQASYDGDCEKRPLYSVCLSFGDGYTWLVFDAIVSTEMQESADYTIEIYRGEQADYYHVLYTDFVRAVEN